MSINFSLSRDDWPIAGGFAISRGRRDNATTLTVTAQMQGYTGCGESVPYARYGESVGSVSAQIAAATAALHAHTDAGAARQELQGLLPAGAARNALDCALWDLEAKSRQCAVWQLLGRAAPDNIVTAYTLGLDDLKTTRAKARDHAWRPVLKIKTGGADDLARLAMVREAAPQSRLIVDANEGWAGEALAGFVRACQEFDVAVIEQPVPVDADEVLRDVSGVVVCADEAVHTAADLPKLRGKYQMVNIKLDKTGGLTEALKLKQQAEASGFLVMVGCMLGTSLAMAPALLLVEDATTIVDLDGPLLLAKDRAYPLQFCGSEILPASPRLWGLI